MTSISLPNLPDGLEFEEFISAFFQSGRFYIERNVIERDIEEILELDIIATDYEQSPPLLRLIELKSGSWGFGDIFKVKGWVGYLNLSEPLFITKKARANLEFIKAKAKALGVNLIVIEDLAETAQLLEEWVSPEDINAIDITAWRFSYWVERTLLKVLNQKQRAHPDKKCFGAIKRYYFEVSSGIFFTENIVERLNKLYDAFRESPHISAKCGNEMIGKDFDQNHAQLPQSVYNDTFYQCNFNEIQISTFVEHRARLAILKSAVDLKLYESSGETHKVESYIDFLGMKISKFDFLPDSFIRGLDIISTHPFYHKYPVFWQYFMWLFGGFILKDYEDQEYQLLSSQTGIPVNEIPNALSAYEILFPNIGGWFLDLSPNSNIKLLKMFPVPFRGIGAFYRRLNYGPYETLTLTGKHTFNDIVRWNNLIVQILANHG